jgi:hypothetical protein
MPATFDERILDRPHPLLETNQVSDFSRNFRQMEKASKRPYSITKVIRELGRKPPKLTGFEAEISQELSALSRERDMDGPMIPMAVLSKRDLSVATYPEIVQTSVETDVIPFLRYKAVTGRLGATLLTDLVGGPWKLPRATATGGANWLAELANATNNEAAFDQITLTPSRISANSIVSTQLVAQAQPDIEQVLIDELNAAIAIETDRVVLNGSGVAPQPLGILNLPVNPAATYAYNARSPNISFGGPASWATITSFETTIDEGAQAHNDGTYGWAVGPTVRAKWITAQKALNYPSYLWDQGIEIDGTVAGRKALNTAQLPTGSVIFGRWSDALIATWAGAEILVNPYVRAHQAEHLITLNFLVAVNFRYSSAFVASSDSGAQ